MPNDLARALTEQGNASAGRIAPETTPIDTPFAGYAIFLAFPAFTTLAHATLPPPARNVHAHNALALCLRDTLAGANALRLIDDPGWRTLLDVPKHLRSAALERGGQAFVKPVWCMIKAVIEGVFITRQCDRVVTEKRHHYSGTCLIGMNRNPSNQIKRRHRRGNHKVLARLQVDASTHSNLR